jgi:hypothetical protein
MDGIEEAFGAVFDPLRHSNKKKWPSCSWQYGSITMPVRE